MSTNGTCISVIYLGEIVFLQHGYRPFGISQPLRVEHPYSTVPNCFPIKWCFFLCLTLGHWDYIMFLFWRFVVQCQDAKTHPLPDENPLMCMQVMNIALLAVFTPSQLRSLCVWHGEIHHFQFRICSQSPADQSGRRTYMCHGQSKLRTSVSSLLHYSDNSYIVMSSMFLNIYT